MSYQDLIYDFIQIVGIKRKHNICCLEKEKLVTFCCQLVTFCCQFAVASLLSLHQQLQQEFATILNENNNHVCKGFMKLIYPSSHVRHKVDRDKPYKITFPFLPQVLLLNVFSLVFKETWQPSSFSPYFLPTLNSHSHVNFPIISG